MGVTRCGGCGRLLPEGVPGCGNCGRPVDWVPTPYVPAEDMAPPVLMAARLPLFPVATHKFVLLSVCTFGAYVVYWCYQNWVRIKDASGTDISPFWRAVMAPVSCYWLFKEIRTNAVGQGLHIGWRPATLAVLYFAMSALANLPSEWSLVSVLSVLPLIPAHQATVRINDLHAAASSEDRNVTYSGANLAAIVVGGVILLAAVATIFLSESDMQREPGASQTIDAYIDEAPVAVQPRLRRVRRTIKAAAPGATESISYRIPTFTLNGPLVHFAVFSRHIGFYPGASGIAAFTPQLHGYRSAKGSVQFPLDQPVPYDLITKIVRHCVKENAARARVRRAAEKG